MDDLEQTLSSLLNDPAALERVQGLLQSLGASGDAEPPAPATEPAPEPAAGAPTAVSSTAGASTAGAPTAGAPDLSGLLGLLGAAASAPDPAAGTSGDPLGKLAPLLTASAGESPDAALLKALRPYLHGEREKRLDDALQMMRLTKILPLLRM